MAKWFYPDIFKDFEPEELHREYMEKFQGVKYQGVYVYPQSTTPELKTQGLARQLVSPVD